MPIEVPALDQRNYTEILQDALARIPVHNPSWTNFNDSDPGVTMIQLFAFMTESLLYRANQIPERNRLKFLTLLGIPLRPAATARGFVTINNERGPLEVKVVPKGVDVRAGQVRFRTTQALTALPIESRVFFKNKLPPPTTDEEKVRTALYTQLYADLIEEDNSVPAFYAVTPMPQPDGSGVLPMVNLADDTVDHSLWIALLARKGDTVDDVRAKLANKVLTVGVMPGTDAGGVVVEAGQTGRQEARNPLKFEIASGPTNDEPTYAPLESLSQGSPLTAPTLVEVKLPGTAAMTWDAASLEPGLEGTGELPPSLADTNISDRVVTWLRLRVDAGTPAVLSWAGVNATMVQQQDVIEGEMVGAGTGQPDQCVSLANTPVLPESLVLTVDRTVWHRVDDILTAGAEVPVVDPRRPIYSSEVKISATDPRRSQVYTLDAESGQVCFGDGAHGMRPRPGAPIVASYAFGGGRQGNVSIGSINRSPQLPASYKVNNPLPTWGGDESEDVSSAEKTIPRTVQHRDRLVSKQDFRDITLRTPGVDLGRVEVLPLYDPSPEVAGPIPGAVTVLVIPVGGVIETPQPDHFFLETVCNHLQPRRLITTELHVYGPKYVDIWISVAIEVLGGFASGPVREAVRQEILRFMSPLYGGHGGTGWPLNVDVEPDEIEAVAARVDGVRTVKPVLLGTATLNGVDIVPISNLSLPRLVGVSVAEGEPVPLDQLKNVPAVSNPPEGQRWTPIPVLPDRC